jgi:two-component system, chemotaxis family, protein-glutamate methylesterase/glutaminase
MSPCRLLIVDASAVIRRALTAALSAETGIEVVGSASSGRIAMMKLPLLRPDVIALDVDLPGSETLDTLAAIRAATPRVPVVLLSAASARATAATTDALKRGARDYIVKPEGDVPSGVSIALLGADLVSKIDTYCLSAVAHRPALTPGRRSGFPPNARVDIVAIGVSTGGPSALMELLPQFAADFPVPIVIVQHMPPMFTNLLAERLTARSQIKVIEGAQSRLVEPGHAWIAPGGFHMAVVRDDAGIRLITHRDAREHSCRPAVDVLFRSVAAVYGPHALAVVMTGMGQDGLRGCEHIHAAGGHVLAQDEPSSVVWGMPGGVARAGLADQVLPLDQLGAEIIERVYRDREIARVTA